MALLTSYSDANKQVLEPETTVVYDSGTTLIGWNLKIIRNTIVSARYKYVGMTEAAAVACAEAVADPAAGINAVVSWVGGRMFEVEVTKYEASWALVDPA